MDACAVYDYVEVIGVLFDLLCSLEALLLGRDVAVNGNNSVRAAGNEVVTGSSVVTSENCPLAFLVKSFNAGA